MKAVDVDEITAVRRIRHEISAECRHDVHKVAAYCQAVAEQLIREGKLHPKDTKGRSTPETSNPSKA